MSTIHDKVDACIVSASITSDAVEITNDQLYPFIFARATKESQELYGNDLGELVIRDWIVVIALPDFKFYDARWMCDEEQGDYCLVPDVDISLDKDHVFSTFKEARAAVGKWWVQQMTAELTAKRFAIPEDETFTFYWRDGKRSVLKGSTVENAFTRAGYDAGALPAVDWYDRGDTDTHTWDTDIKNWVKRPEKEFQ